MKDILRLFILSRLTFIAFALVATLLPLHFGYLGNYLDAPYLIWIWSNFDGQHFLDIVTNGYRNFNFAFFPFYPFVVFLTKNILQILPLYAGIIVSTASLLLSAFVIYKIVLLDYKEPVAKLTVLFLFYIPVSFFHHSVYADSLFLLTTSGCFYFARRGNWFLSGLFGFLSSLTRLSGLALIPALILEWYIQRKGKSLPFSQTVFKTLFLTTLGILVYMMYLQFKFGDPFLFQKSMVAWSQSEFTFPPQVIFRYLKILTQVDLNLLVYWIALLELISFIFYFSLTIYVWKKVRISYALFMGSLLILVMFTGTLAGTPRYILHLFPAFLALALILERRNNIRFLIIQIFLSFGFLLTALFTRGYFIT